MISFTAVLGWDSGIGYVFQIHGQEFNKFRRKTRAGLLWILKQGGGVRLLTEEGVRTFTAGLRSTGVDPTGVELSSAVDSRPVTATGVTGVEVKPPIIIEKVSRKEGTSTSYREVPAVVKALIETMGHGDDDAALRILESCRQNTPDVTTEEITAFIRSEGARILKMKGIERPMGLLIRQVPACMQGESFRLYREQMQKGREAAERQKKELIKYWREQLVNAGMDEDRDFARQYLEELEKSTNDAR